MHTINGGDIWEQQFFQQYMTFWSIHFSNFNKGWAAGDGCLYHTTDGGTTWVEQDSRTNNWLTDVFFVNENVGWAVGSNGTVINTNNGGFVGLDKPLKTNKECLSLKVSPNPFTTSTTISFTLTDPSTAYIRIFNSQGQLVDEMILEGSYGPYKVKWDAGGLPAGMYYFRIQAGDVVGGGKMVVMK